MASSTTTLGTSTSTLVVSTTTPTSATSTTTLVTPTAPTTTTTTPWTTAAPPSGLCENGGTPGGSGCLCSPSYAGPRCEFSTDTVETNLPFPGTIMATLDVEVTVTNFNYSEDLKDPTSETFRSFQNHFRQEIKKIYGTLPGYEGVEITSLKPGSVVVGHQVFFTMAQSSSTTEKFQETTGELVDNLQEAEASQGNCQHNTSVLCLVLRPNPVVSDMREVLDLDELCHQRAPPGYGDFFSPDISSGVLHCVTSCTPNLPQSLDCHHGRCHVTREGPRCFCPDEDLYWYTGAQCSGRVSKVATGLGVAVALLFLICLILVVVLLCRRHRRSRSDLPPYSGGSWYEFDDFTWSPPRGAVIPNPGVAPQPPFEDPESWRRPPGPPPAAPRWGPRAFRPSLERVDPFLQLRTPRPRVTHDL
ncbi:mucin-3B-like [Vidua chalybeata]|uniref:mucin-3B-like n=1 Tax=Vidua chalybeata TaxID=81927 RepID=UPI0023A8D255|nr:mucin-3B-like [Vidua chalybeata]